MLRSLFEVVAGADVRPGLFEDVERAWNLLADAESVAPAVVEDVVMYPTVGVQLAKTLHDSGGVAPSWREIGVLHSMAAAAAVRSGLRCTIAVPVVHGAVTLPTVGQWQLRSTGFPAGRVELSIADGEVSLGHACTFLRAKEHRVSAAGRTLAVTFEDLDVYREFTAPVAPAPLDAVEYEEWVKLLDEAWRLLARWHEGCAEELASGLRALIPLGAGTAVFAASSSNAFGAIAMSAKATATQLAEALVHEVQHSKLNALMDLVDLTTGETGWVYAPWRDDPRGLLGLLHGIYAFTAVVEFWHVQRDLVPPAESRRAHFAFALRRAQVRAAVDSLRGSTRLTDLGRAFVAAASVRLSVCETAPVAVGLAKTVTGLLTEHRAVWRAHHLRPEPADVETVAEAWMRGAKCAGRARSQVVPSGVTGTRPRSALLEMRALTPDRFDQAVSLESADAMFARGERTTAATAYERRIRTDPRDVDAWIGLGLASQVTALLDEPATVRAVHAYVTTRTGAPPAPAELAAWMTASR
ncbi:HEXXH motif domain-containing protein [Lentzea sp. NBC_00516]|uniref:HEXXH motif domain-containing protein n=1 Tax=Lentzea sp. NBC_00516 TaxID=2903582 RepID=UPI002E8166DF|nr:HEXXH motif domain-containing protein [Lentzea sp. NBC_00516]WUD27555.1 HEXXH motif domain-containing protein [Lentzea sp. NBC_00516]